jgi:hypothetical protein
VDLDDLAEGLREELAARPAMFVSDLVRLIDCVCRDDVEPASPSQSVSFVCWRDVADRNAYFIAITREIWTNGDVDQVGIEALLASSPETDETLSLGGAPCGYRSPDEESLSAPAFRSAAIAALRRMGLLDRSLRSVTVLDSAAARLSLLVPIRAF